MPPVSEQPTHHTTSTCPLCGSNESRYFFEERGHRLVACTHCELFYIDPYPSVEKAHEHVVEDSYSKELDVIGAERYFRGSQRFYDWFFPRIERHFAGAKSYLDIGCGAGYLLCLVGKQFPGISREGIELNRQRAAYAAQVTGCKIHEMPLEAFRPGRRYDVITMINVLSHLPSFDRLFEAMHALLAPGGRLILKAGEWTSQIDKSSCFDYGLPGHMHFLGLKTIDTICKKYSMKKLHHERQPVKEQLFARWRFLSPGRSHLRNLAKRIIAYTPGGLKLAAKYSTYGHGMNTSIIVLSPDTPPNST